MYCTEMDVETRNKLVMKYYKMVVKWALDFYNQSSFIKRRLPADEVIQIALISFIRALQVCRGKVEEIEGEVFLRDGEFKVPQQIAYFKRCIYLQIKQEALESKVIRIPHATLKRVAVFNIPWPEDYYQLPSDGSGLRLRQDNDHLTNVYAIVDTLLQCIPEDDRNLIVDYYGLAGGESHYMTELARDRKVSRAMISGRLEKLHNNLREAVYKVL